MKEMNNFIQVQKLRFLLERQHRFVLRQQSIIDVQKKDIEELKKRIEDLLMLSDDQLKEVRKDEYITALIKGKNEAMNKIRNLEYKKSIR